MRRWAAGTAWTSGRSGRRTRPARWFRCLVRTGGLPARRPFCRCALAWRGRPGSADLAGSADLTEPVGRAERPAKLPRMSCPEVSSDSASSCDSNFLCASGPPSNGFWNDSVFASPGSSTAGRVSVGSSETSAIPMTSVNGTSRVFSSLISFPFRWRFSRRSFHRRCHAIGRPSFPLAACCRTCTAW